MNVQLGRSWITIYRNVLVRIETPLFAFSLYASGICFPYGVYSHDVTKSPFKWEQNRVRTRPKSTTDRTFLGVYKGNNLPRVGQKVG